MQRLWIRTVRLLLLFAVVSLITGYAQVRLWKVRLWSTPLTVVIYPINTDSGNPAVAAYLDRLDGETFEAVDGFFAREHGRYMKSANRPTHSRLSIAQIDSAPPLPPTDTGFIASLGWNIRFRIWTLLHLPDEAPNSNHINVFVHYREPKYGIKLHRRLGPEKGLFKAVHVHADINRPGRNNVRIVHAILHAAGATDKYGDNGEPLFPEGYAAPKKTPLYPQNQAEIMAPRIPVSNNTSRKADSLEQCIVGPVTAAEIRWLRSSERNATR
ncbi:MAG: hypothetical protein ACU84J_00590 [Gammaproteobacteria bacterium]